MVDIALSNISHVLLSQLISRQGSIDESCGLLLIKIEKFFPSFNAIVITEESLRANLRRVISIFLFIFPVLRAVAPVTEAVIWHVQGHTLIWLHVLSQRQIYNPVSCKLISWLHQHLSRCFRVFNELIKWIIG